VEHNRAVRVEDALGLAGRAGRVAERRRLALCDLRVVVAAVARLVEKLLVAERARQLADRPVTHHDEVLDVWQLQRQRAERGRERVVDEDDPVLGVVDDVGDLLGEEAEVDRV